jgi:outer membrane protein assembly factor BamB
MHSVSAITFTFCALVAHAIASPSPAISGVAWTSTYAANVTSVTGKGGAVYFADDDGVVYCLNGTSGAPSWKRALSESIVLRPGFDESDDGAIYVGTNASAVKLNRATGDVTWQTSSSSGFATGQPVGWKGYVYFVFSGQTVVNYDTNTGKLLSSAPSTSSDPIVVTTLSGETAVYTGDLFGNMQRFTSENLNAVCSLQQPTAVSRPVVLQTVVIAAQADGVVVAMDAHDCRQLWVTQLPHVDNVVGDVAVSESLKNLYVVDSNGGVSCVAAFTGKVTWQYNHTTPFESTPLAHGSYVFAVDVAGVVVVVNATSGELVQTWAGPQAATPGVHLYADNDVLYVALQTQIIALKLNGQ